MFDNVPSIGPHVKAGRVRGLGVSSPKRAASFPDIPTIAEAGVPGYETNSWGGIIGPARLPREVVMKLNSEIRAALKVPLGGRMAPDSITAAGHGSQSDTFLRRILGGMSAVSMLMTVPQVWIIWVNHHVAGVSVLSWSTYLVSALLWFWYGVQQRDKNIYLPCIGWLGLDAGVIAGVVHFT